MYSFKVSPYKPEATISFPSTATNLLAPLTSDSSFKEEFSSHCHSSTAVFYEGAIEDSSLLRSIIESTDIPFEQEAKSCPREGFQSSEHHQIQMNHYVEMVGFSNHQAADEDFDWDSLFNANVY